MPTCPLVGATGSWVEITGHLDDPAASTCKAKLAEVFDGPIPPPPDPGRVVFDCRLAFVATAVRAAEPPIIQ